MVQNPGMVLRISHSGAVALAFAALTLLSGCGGGKKPPAPYFVATHENWRDDRERACLKSGAVRETAYIEKMNRIDGPSECGARAPFKVAALGGGNVMMSTPATLRCSMVSALDGWVRDDVQRAARAAFGEAVTDMRVAASYSCRPRNNSRGAKLSEHGYANAFDVSAFTLASGRVVTVEDGWRGSRDEQRFLRTIHEGACDRFTTVIGPDGDRMHYNHIHMDLAQHGRTGTYRYCK